MSVSAVSLSDNRRQSVSSWLLNVKQADWMGKSLLKQTELKMSNFNASLTFSTKPHMHSRAYAHIHAI